MTSQKLSFPIAAILAHRDRLVKRAFRPMGPIMLRGRFLDELVGRVMGLLPNDVLRDPVFESLRYLSGKKLTDTESLAAAWRIAGNVPRLREGLPALPWTVQTEKEWVPLEVISSKPFRDQWNRIGNFFEFRVLAGTPCPMKIQAFWSDALGRAVSRRLGFSAPWDHYPFKSPMEFVRLRCIVSIDPALSQRRPVFRDFHEELPASIIIWNRKVLKIRKRIRPCPHRWTHPCHKCAVGYENCVGGVHRLNYEKRACLNCGKVAYFDDDLSTDRCLNCQHRLLLQRKQK